MKYSYCSWNIVLILRICLWSYETRNAKHNLQSRCNDKEQIVALAVLLARISGNKSWSWNHSIETYCVCLFFSKFCWWFVGYLHVDPFWFTLIRFFWCVDSTHQQKTRMKRCWSHQQKRQYNIKNRFYYLTYIYVCIYIYTKYVHIYFFVFIYNRLGGGCIPIPVVPNS